MDSENKLGGNFTIDDAFESDEEDPIRVYGSRATTERSALTEKRRPEDVKVEVDEHHEQVTDAHEGLLIPDARFGNIIHGDSDPSFTSSYSDVYSTTTKPYPDKRWWKHPKVRENWKIVLASFALLIIGLGLVITGIVIEVTHITAVQSFIFFIAGAICFIPGAYHVVYIYCAVKGKRGFPFHNLSVFR